MAQTLVQRENGKRAAPAIEEAPPLPDAPATVASAPGAPAAGASAAPAKKPSRRPLLIGAVVLLVIAGVVTGIIYWVHGQHYESTDDATLEGHVVPISPQISARVAAVYVLDNQLVKKGDLLVDLDPTDYQVAVNQAKGSLAAVQGKLAEAHAQVPAANALRDQAKAEVDAAQTNFQNADADLKRYQSLDARARSQEQLDNATNAQKSAKAQVEQAEAKLASAVSQIATAQATIVAAQGDVEKAQADVQRAEVNLGYCQITASEDGRITRKNVEPGAYVTPEQALLAIVPPEVWVVADFKETQLTYMRPGQAVTVHLDAYPGTDFTGHVDSIQSGTGARFSMLPAENATGNFVKIVQRVPVKILLDPDQNSDLTRALVPGMSVEAEVRVR